MRGIVIILAGIYLVVVAFFDLRKKCIQNRWIVISFLFLLPLSVCFYEISVRNRILGLAVGALMIFISFITKEQIGYGDSLIFCQIGFLFGLQICVSILIYSFGICFLYSVILLVLRKVSKHYRLAFLPFVFISYVGTMLYERI